MESIREIICLSHDGIDRMWYPFSADLNTHSSVISAGNYYEIGELLMLIQSMFATNNYSPEMVNGENFKATRKFLVGEKMRRRECSLTFRTEANKYKLDRCFYGNYSIEARLQKTDSDVVYIGEDVIKMLGKFHKPFVIAEGRLFNYNSTILKPDNEFTRKSMVAMANSWARMVGIQDSRLELNHAGRWSSSGDYGSRGSTYRSRRPSPLTVLTCLSQAVMRKRKYGKCPPVICPFNVDTLSEFESIAMLDLVKHVAIEEGIQFIIGINGKPEINSIVETISTPNLTRYYT